MLAAQARRPLDLPLVGGLLASAGVAVLFWHAAALYPFKLLTVLMHESGHAAATLLVGGRVQSIQVSPDEAGLTRSLYAPALWRAVLIASAGYLGSTLSGCVLLWTAARSRAGRWPLVALAAWCGGVALVWVRDGFTLLFTAGCALLLAVCARFAPAAARRGLLVFLAGFSTCYALYDIRDDLLHFGGSGGSDADALARLTYIPALVWGLAWGLLSLLCVALTLRRIFARGMAISRAA